MGVNALTAAVRAATEQDLEAINDLYNHYVRTSHATFDVQDTTMGWRRTWFDEIGRAHV